MSRWTRLALVASMSSTLWACSSPGPEQSAFVPALDPAPLEEEWAVDWWRPRHEEKLAERDRDPELVFLGDSITQGWEEEGEAAFERAFGQWRTLNLGFSGDRTENVLWRLEHGAVEGIEPELVVLMIGTNNTGHRMDPPEQIAAGVIAIVDQLRTRLPQADILLLSIFPRGETPEDPERANNRAVNEHLRDLDQRPGVYHADLNGVFTDERGRLKDAIMPDRLHPNADGYDRLAERLAPLVESLIEHERLPASER